MTFMFKIDEAHVTPPAISTAHKESTRLPYIVVHTMLWTSLALYDLYV